MNRPLAAILPSRSFPFLFLLAVGLSARGSASAAPRTDETQSVLRLRGGTVSPDPDYDPGPGWSAGGAVGFVLNRNVLLSVSYDHLDLDNRRSYYTRRVALNPVTLELEVGSPQAHRVVPRLAAGAGLYFHKDVYYEYSIYSYSPYRHYDFGSTFGMHFGGGLSIPLWNRTLMDIDGRYHLGTDQDDNFAIATASAGLRFQLSRPTEEPKGYVELEPTTTLARR